MPVSDTLFNIGRSGGRCDIKDAVVSRCVICVIGGNPHDPLDQLGLFLEPFPAGARFISVLMDSCVQSRVSFADKNCEDS